MCVATHSKSHTDALSAGPDFPKGLIRPPPKPLSFLDDSHWTMRLGTNNRSRDGNTSAYAVMACPHMHALMSRGSGRAFDSAGSWCFPCKDPASLIWLSLQCHISSPLPWHLPPKKLVSRSSQLAAPVQVTSQKGDPGTVVSV